LAGSELIGFIGLDTEVLHVVRVDSFDASLLSPCGWDVLVAVEVRRAHNLKKLYDEKNLTLKETYLRYLCLFLNPLNPLKPFISF